MKYTTGIVLLAAGLAGLLPSNVSAQGRPFVVEVGAGRGWFVDSPPAPHLVVGASARFYLSPRLSVGPEFTWMRGPGRDRDTFLTGNLTWDLRPAASAPSSTLRLVPYVLAGGGVMTHTGAVGVGTYTSTEGAFTAGGGVRFVSSSGWFVAPEARIGWETHWRYGVVVGGH